MVGLATSAASATPVESPAAGEPWDYDACTTAAQRCNAWIFKDGFEGGDGGLW